MKRSMWLQVLLFVMTALCFSSCGGGESGLNNGGGTLSLTANPTSINADGISFSTITAVLVDNTGNPAAQGTEMDFTTNLGVFANGQQSFQTVTDAKGTAVVILYAGITSGNVTVQCSAGGLVTLAYLKFVAATPGPVSSIVLSATNTSIIADGISSTIITAILKDANGIPVSLGTSVSFVTNLGIFANNQKTYVTTTADENGTAVATLISTLTPGTATITCTSGNISAVIKIEIKSF